MKLYPVVILFILNLLAGFVSALHGQNISGIVNTYHQVTAINTATNTFTLTSAAGLSPGVRVLVIQMKGAMIDNTNTASFGNITGLANAGNYEFNYVCGVNGNNVMLVYDLQRSYDTSGLVQLVSVPRYTAAVVTDTLKAAPWNAAQGTGGVIALQAGSISLTAPMDADGKGFKGGAYVDHPIPPYNCDWATNIIGYFMSNPASGFNVGGTKGEGISAVTAAMEFGKGKLANGGGGANNHNAGGAGGANYAAGGNGGMRSNEGTFNCHGQNPGLGGLGLSAYGYTAGNNRVYLGGGGGAGQGNNNVGMPGANGGGLIFIIADTLYGNNNLIRANGDRPYRADLANPYAAGGDGGGGGGGGGVVVLNVSTYIGSVTVQAKGGDGSYSSYTPSSGCFGPGGGGGGGVIWMSGAVLNPLVSAAVTGGANGLISNTTSVTACHNLANGATAGGNGVTLTGYTLPVGGSLVCAPLALNDLLYLRAAEKSGDVELSWKMLRTTGISRYEIEQSVDRLQYRSVASIPNNSQYNFSFTDRHVQDEYLYYRLKLWYTDGRVLYSNEIQVHVKSRGGFQLLRLSPNPSANDLSLTINTTMQGNCDVQICSRTGQKIITRNYILRKGINKLVMNVQHLIAGTYFLVVRQGDKNVVRSFLKTN
ncbi:MAG: T9SS type A sorting domain-containing protein [Chitinophagaceae bacterium]